MLAYNSFCSMFLNDRILKEANPFLVLIGQTSNQNVSHMDLVRLSFAMGVASKTYLRPKTIQTLD